MKTEKRTVRLDRIEPNENNPRKEFGDIDALANAIRATGGEPVNPIVVVEDEDRFVIVDGERRYRALTSMCDGSHETDVLVVDDYSTAAELVAMLATDDKLALTDAERSQGFQLGLVLGVPDEPLAQATRTDVEAVKGARRVWRGLTDKDRTKYQQATIDQLAKAAEFEGKDRDMVLRARPGAWASVARDIESRKRRDASISAMMDKAAMLGIEWRTKLEDSEKEAMSNVKTLWFSLSDPKKAAKELADAVKRYGATVVSEKDKYCHTSDCVGLWAPKDHEETPEEKASREKAEMARRRKAARKSLKRRVSRYVFAEGIYPALSALVVENRFGSDSWTVIQVSRFLSKLGLGDENMLEAIKSSVSAWDVVSYLCWLGTEDWEKYWSTSIVEALKPYGFEPTEEDEWLMEQEAEKDES